MNRRTLIAVWKANMPVLAWGCSPLWIGGIILGLDGDPQWSSIVLFAATVLTIQAIAELANSYTDREEDRVYFPSNPLVKGELSAEMARRALILENLAAGALLVALLLATLNYGLVITVMLGWLAGLAYSLPPFKFKATMAGPLFIAIGCALLPVSGWLVVAPLSQFIIAFSVFFFIHTLGYGITHKLRKTVHALSHGLIHSEQDGGGRNPSTVDLGIRVKTALVLEAAAALGAFIMVPIFWRLDVFDASLSIGLLSVPLALTALSIAVRARDAIGNGQKGVAFMTVGWASIMLVWFGVAVGGLVHWGFAVLACVVFLIGFAALLRTVHAFGPDAIAAPWAEL